MFFFSTVFMINTFQKNYKVHLTTARCSQVWGLKDFYIPTYSCVFPHSKIKFEITLKVTMFFDHMQSRYFAYNQRYLNFDLSTC